MTLKDFIIGILRVLWDDLKWLSWAALAIFFAVGLAKLLIWLTQ